LRVHPYPGRRDEARAESRLSAIHSPTLDATIALGYMRRGANAVGTELGLRTSDSERGATIVAWPFVK